MKRPPGLSRLTNLEVCAGAGGQALGLEHAGFEHLALLEYDHWPCLTLKANRPSWPVIRGDVRKFSALLREPLDLLAGGVPCPPFSVAGKQLGQDDERDLFPEMIRLTRELLPRAVMIENVRGLLDPAFDDYRDSMRRELEDAGYGVFWERLDAKDFGVPQLRPRVVLVAIEEKSAIHFEWPERSRNVPPSVGQVLRHEMGALGWEGADDWAERADGIAPTLVGGSKKHGGPDLGPSRARKAWADLGVNGRLLAEEPPRRGFRGWPCLTVKMAAMIQGFPADWEFAGKKTNAYRQVGNAFPPPVARAVGNAIGAALDGIGHLKTPGPKQLQLGLAGSDEAAA